MKKLSILCILVLLLLTGCGGGGLKGTYVGEDSGIKIEFKSNGTCTWTETGLYFEGKYEKCNDGSCDYVLKIQGSGIFPSQSFDATKLDNSSLKIDVYGGDIFTKR